MLVWTGFRIIWCVKIWVSSGFLANGPQPAEINNLEAIQQPLFGSFL